jgi:hypothetical protein
VNQKVKVQFSLFDWKWLSEQALFSDESSDPLVMAGLEEGVVRIEFKRLVESDKAKESKYVAGGRAYFEADVIGSRTLSFTTKGFFDQLNYQEPTSSTDIRLQIILGVTIPLGALMIGTFIMLYFYFTRKNKKIGHLD